MKQDNETRYHVTFISEDGLQRRICYGELQLKILKNRYDVISVTDATIERSVRDVA